MLTHFPEGVVVETAMDADFLASKVNGDKHGNHLVLDNSEVNDDDDARTYFTYPFCYVDTELSMLCDHLREEHCFDVKNAVCPVCALNLGKDVVGHFKVHHASSIKAGRRSQKSGFWSFYTGRSSLSGLSAKSGSEHVNGSAPDPLLSPFLCSIQYLETKGDQSQDSCHSEDVAPINEMQSPRTSMVSLSEEKEDSQELRQRASFCQQLIFSTIF